MTTSTLTKSNTEYLRDYWRTNNDFLDLIDEHSGEIDSFNPNKIYIQYVNMEDRDGYDLWYKVGRRYVCIYSARHSYDSFNYGNSQNSFRAQTVIQRFPTDKDGYSIPLIAPFEDETKASATYGGCSLKRLIDS